MINERKLNNH